MVKPSVAPVLTWSCDRALSVSPAQDISLQDKTEMLLELYGNTLVRSKTAEYVEQASTRLIDLVSWESFTSPASLASLGPARCAVPVLRLLQPFMSP